MMPRIYTLNLSIAYFLLPVPLKCKRGFKYLNQLKNKESVWHKPILGIPAGGGC